MEPLGIVWVRLELARAHQSVGLQQCFEAFEIRSQWAPFLTHGGLLSTGMRNYTS